MRILPLLNKSLKDDAILEMLEWGDGYVIYDFDRCHENVPDVYYAHCKKRGICMRFNEEQKLDAIFLYILGVEGYTALDLSEVEDVTFFPRWKRRPLERKLGSSQSILTNPSARATRCAGESQPKVFS